MADNTFTSSRGGRSKYCCVPGCKSSFYNNQGEKTNISFFSFPLEAKSRNRWLLAIKRQENRDGFVVTEYTKVCEQHFRPEEIKKQFSGRKDLKDKTTIPSIFSWNKSASTPNRKLPKRDVLSKMKKIFSLNQNHLEVKLSLLIKQKSDVEKDWSELKAKIQKLEKGQFTSKNIREQEDVFKSFTGFHPVKFDILFQFLNPGENASNLKYYEPSKNGSDEPDECKFTEGSKPGVSPKLDVIEQLFMFLVWLRCGFGQKHLVWLFGLGKSTISRYLITWSNYLYFCLGNIPIWPSKDQIVSSMPICFKDTYPSTRCIIDCTEIFVQVPSSLTTQSALYSHYKHHVTYKALVGISPSGAITFVSQLYPGSLSDKEIVSRCGILHPELWEKGDSIMADRGFTIQELLDPLGVKLNIPAFLDGKEQLDKEDVVFSQTIASVRIHVERIIARIKKFKVLKTEIPLNMNGTINQIWTVACLLCNFMDPLIKQ
ncbi:unnamed protein product [Porites lobata]|uniref:THAP-type domain-containing protein n=1 Tax=Porites lobata TaxID=104759 RepID=A0ABN8RZZ3_9CNID|nr:unnamed protein product [Porites lobata]